jgi:hypothetical protein
MTIRTNVSIIILLIIGMQAHAEDWHKLFQGFSSTDAAISGPARDHVFNILLPSLFSEDGESLNRDITAAVKELSGPENVRVQVSGLLTALAMFRVDGSTSLRSAIPALIS